MDSQVQSELPLTGLPNNAITSNNKNVSHDDSTMGKLRRYFEDYCDNSSMIGFKYLAERRSVGERVLWFVLILIAFALSTYYILELYYKYEENPFIVNLATRESPIYTIPFPAVTICPGVKATKDVFNFTNAVQKIWNKETLTEEEKKNTQYMSLLCDSLDDSYLDELPANETFTDDFYNQIDYLKPIKDSIFFACMFMGDFVNCDDIFVPIILDDGVCYTFNMLNRKDIYKDDVVHYSDYHQNHNDTNWNIDDGYPKGRGRGAYPKRALLAGADNSLEVILMQDALDTDRLCMRDAPGYSAVIHTPHLIPQLRRQYIAVPIDNSIEVTLQPKMMTTSREVKSYRPSARQCYFADERPLKYFKIYNPDNCWLECLTNFTMNRCGCVNFYMPRNHSMKVCGNGMRQCLEDSLYEMKEREIESILEERISIEETCNCMPLCTELSYSTEAARLNLPWREQFRAAKKFSDMLDAVNINLTDLHISRLSVYFKFDHFQTSQRNELYGPFDFLANFGGIVGLFTGFSLLSAVEILYFVSVRLWCNRRLYNDYSGPRTDV